MRKTMIIPTYWCRKTGDPWQEGDAVYDHPTPVDQEGTLERTLVSMKQFHEKDFKLVILICPTTPEVEAAAYEQVLRIVGRVQLNAETYLFTAGDLREITEILRKAGLNDRGVQLLSMFGYSNGPVDKSKNSAETHSGSGRTVNLEIAKDGTYHPLEV